MKLLKLSDLTHFWGNVRKHLPTKISDLTDDKDLLSSHEDINLDNLPNESPIIRFINNTPSYTWREMPHGDLIDWSYFGNPYDQELTFLTSSSKIVYKNNSNSQNTCELAFGQTNIDTKTILTMNYYYGSNDTNEPDDDSNYVSSSLVFSLNPGYNNFASSTFDETEYSSSDVSPDCDNYYIGKKNPFKEIRAKDFTIALDEWDFSLTSGLNDIYTHLEDTDIHVSSSDKSTWNAKANDNAVVHTSGNETVTGIKTFGNGSLIIDNSTGNNVHGEIKFNGSRPGYIVADNSSDGVFDNTESGISILLQDAGKPLHIGGYRTDSNGRVFADNTNKNPVLTVMGSLIKTSILIPEGDSANNAFRILSQINYANGDTSKVLDVRFQQHDNANATSAIYSYADNKTSLGATTKRWSGVYSTNYYYGADNVEFSTKFMTTDTVQTISAKKTFSISTYLYNSDDTGNTPSLYFKSSKAIKGDSSGSNADSTRISHIDKNDKLLSYIQLRKVSNGSSDITLYCSTVDTNNQEISSSITFFKSVSNLGVLRPTVDNDVSLGDTSYRWKDVHANTYYYGNDNVEFSTKFTTTDTDQTISGVKTFSSSPVIYNSDTTATTPQITLKNSKVTKSSTTETGAQLIYFTDKNNAPLSIIESRAIDNGNTSLMLKAYNLDTSNDSVSGGLQIVQAPSGTYVLPTTDEAVAMGNSLFKWSDVGTKRINNLQPSALALPMTRDNAIDISSYFTNFNNGDTNQYTPTVNGWIYLETTGCNALHCFCTTGNLVHYGNTVARASDGMAYVTFPVLANNLFKCTWYSNTTITLSRAWFIPCQGNV